MRDKEKVDRLIYEILAVLKENKQNGPMGARLISQELSDRGFEIGERAVRYHLKHLDDSGLTEKPGSLKGRIITKEGEEELKADLVGERVGFVIGRIEELIYQMDYDLQSGEGKVIVNMSLLDEEKEMEALDIMSKVMERKLAPSSLVKIFRENETIGNFQVPKGKIGIATICSITIDGLLQKSGIPVSPKFGGVLEMEDDEPKRFVEAISYRGTSLDPLAVFASKRITSYLDVLETGSGRILANLREIPVPARSEAKDIIERGGKEGLNGVLVIGSPAEDLYGLPVDVNRIGIVVVGGINPAVAVDESDIEIETLPMDSLLDISEMRHIENYI